jgi:hypothetical protein
MIPDTRGGRIYRRILLVCGIASIVGIADQARALFWIALAGPSYGPTSPARILILLGGWVLMCWCSVRAIRRNVLPPTWAVVLMPVVTWAYILWPTLFPAAR